MAGRLGAGIDHQERIWFALSMSTYVESVSHVEGLECSWQRSAATGMRPLMKYPRFCSYVGAQGRDGWLTGGETPVKVASYAAGGP